MKAAAGRRLSWRWVAPDIRFAVANPSHYRVMFGSFLDPDCEPDLASEAAGAFQALVNALASLQVNGVVRGDATVLMARFGVVRRARGGHAWNRWPTSRAGRRRRPDAICSQAITYWNRSGHRSSGVGFAVTLGSTICRCAMIARHVEGPECGGARARAHAAVRAGCSDHARAWHRRKHADVFHCPICPASTARRLRNRSFGAHL